MPPTDVETRSYAERLDALRATKLRQTREKREVLGAMDHDDWGVVLPPPDDRKVVQTRSGSGAQITDCLLAGFEPESNHPSGGFFGPKACGENFRALLDAHPVYLDPDSSLAGAYMANFMSYRGPHWNPELDFSRWQAEHRKYQVLHHGIGFVQHFCQDLAIGLGLGWGGLLAKVRCFKAINAARGAEFYEGLEAVVLGIQHWIERHAEEAARRADAEPDPERGQNLRELAEINRRLATDPPRTFREACQWMLWYQMAARMYNGSGSLGRLDALLEPFYERDRAAGILDDDEAIFHIACLLLRDPAYVQLGGPDASGRDVTSPVSYLVLEAVHRLKIPANVAVAVGENVDPSLLRRGVEILLEDKLGIPKFLGVENTAAGFARCGFPIELGRERIYAGCQWTALPGREYTFNDGVKINLVAVLDVALREMLGDAAAAPSMDELWDRFVRHLRRAIRVLAEGLDFHIEHMHQVFPELVLDLCCHGPIERGLDASHGGVEFYNFGIDAAGLATAADSLAALEQHVEQAGRLSWQKLLRLLDTNWAGPEGEHARLLMRRTPRFGQGGSRADAYAARLAATFTDLVRESPTPAGHNMIPGLFSWAFMISMGQDLGATPNGRRAGEPISHGANPDPGFRRDGAPTAMAAAVAAVQPGYGNTAPWQIDLDPLTAADENAVEVVAALIKSHFEIGGTQVNINIVDAGRLLQAHERPEDYPDLVVRVTGFSAYFCTLSPELRKFVVERTISAR